MSDNKRSPKLKTQGSQQAKTTKEDLPSQDSLWDKCKHLAQDAGLKETIRQRIRAMGYAGSTIPVEANVLMITSRLLPRPMNGANISQSSSGKTKALDTALAFHPPSAYYKVDAGSERILIYNAESFENKMVIFSEADSLPEDGPGAAALRAIITDNKMSYETVVKAKGKDGESFKTQKIEKKGPTGCITTSTRHLREQLGTRMLTMTINDSPEQTRAILLAIANDVNENALSPNMDDFKAFQTYLECYGNRKVYVPLALELAEYVPVDQVRMRRDFKQFLTAIQTSALLYQFQRKIDSQGRIIATCDDYLYAVEVFGELFQEVATDGVPQHIRETVLAVEELGGNFESVTTAQIMTRLNLKSRNTINSRVRTALARELLVNKSIGKAPYELMTGRPLPEEVYVLPPLTEIRSCVDKDCTHHSKLGRTTGQGIANTPVLPSSQDPQDTDQIAQDVKDIFGNSADIRIEDIPV